MCVSSFLNLFVYWEAAFQINWSVKTLSVTVMGLVIVLFTKHRTTTQAYVSQIPFVVGFVTVEVEIANIMVHGIISGYSCEHSHDLLCAHIRERQE